MRKCVRRGDISSGPPALFACNEVAKSSVLIKRQASLEFYDFLKCFKHKYGQNKKTKKYDHYGLLKTSINAPSDGIK